MARECTLLAVRALLAADPEVSRECAAAVEAAVSGGGWMRPAVACAHLGVSRRTLEDYRRRGLVGGHRVSARVALVSAADVFRLRDGRQRA